ncbi:hypothetical protein [Enterococcus sp. AZ186]|uniref:hypothetical protein n=2 Tax=Enterococcus TaxID=1350 RepID=UPI003F687077
MKQVSMSDILQRFAGTVAINKNRVDSIRIFKGPPKAIPFELSILANHQQFPVAIAMNTLISSLAGFAAPILLAATKISVGANSYLAGIVISGLMAVVLLITRLGNRVEKKSDQATISRSEGAQEA